LVYTSKKAKDKFGRKFRNGCIQMTNDYVYAGADVKCTSIHGVK